MRLRLRQLSHLNRRQKLGLKAGKEKLRRLDSWSTAKCKAEWTTEWIPHGFSQLGYGRVSTLVQLSVRFCVPLRYGHTFVMSFLVECLSLELTRSFLYDCTGIIPLSPLTLAISPTEGSCHVYATSPPRSVSNSFCVCPVTYGTLFEVNQRWNCSMMWIFSCFLFSAVFLLSLLSLLSLMRCWVVWRFLTYYKCE